MVVVVVEPKICEGESVECAEFGLATAFEHRRGRVWDQKSETKSLDENVNGFRGAVVVGSMV